MSEVVLRPENAGLAGLLAALGPRDETAAPPPDLAAIRAAGWEEGFVAGRAAAEAELEPLREGLAAAAAALNAAAVIDVAVLRPVLAALVRQVAHAVLTIEVRDGAALAALAEAALAAVRPGEAATLRAAPGTLMALGTTLGVSGVATRADAALGPNEFIVEGGDFVVDVALAARLDEIVEGLA